MEHGRVVARRPQPGHENDDVAAGQRRRDGRRRRAVGRKGVPGADGGGDVECRAHRQRRHGAQLGGPGAQLVANGGESSHLSGDLAAAGRARQGGDGGSGSSRPVERRGAGARQPARQPSEERDDAGPLPRRGLRHTQPLRHQVHAGRTRRQQHHRVDVGVARTRAEVQVGAGSADRLAGDHLLAPVHRDPREERVAGADAVGVEDDHVQ